MPVPPKKILNKPSDSVSEFIEGLLLQYPNHLTKLANHQVLLLASAKRSSNVQIISGGGSGHEPSHAGWIGTGMLSGAVCGGIFASPSVSSILAAIRALHNNDKSDILLIIKNYTGDRLNFGLAAEKANQEGISVEVVVVADDCALSRTKGITGARGVAGTVLVHKIAGAAAAAGKSLQEVADVARKTAARMGTLGIALDSVTLPGAEAVNDRLDAETIEIGLGIHGEAGMKQSKLLTADEMAKEMVSTIRDYGRVVDNKEDSYITKLFESGDDVCVLVNNLGGTSNFELSILARSIVKLLESEEYGVKVTRLMVGTYMTSFDMHGASLTILNTTDQADLLKLLDTPTDAPAWVPFEVWHDSDNTSRPSVKEEAEVVVDESAVETPKPSLTLNNFAASTKTLITSAVEQLAKSEQLLTKYDTIVGDGDCGITMKRGATEILDRLEKGTISTDHPVSLFSSLADAISASMGGTSGVLLELMFRKMSSALSRVDSSIGIPELCQAFHSGVDAVSLYGGAQVGSRTMLDALVPAAAIMVSKQNIAAAAAEARKGADGTASMKSASAGRSNYLSENTLDGTPDPGAVAVAIVMEALAS